MTSQHKYYITDEDVVLVVRPLPEGDKGLIQETIALNGNTGKYGIVRQGSTEVSRAVATQFLIDSYKKSPREAARLIEAACKK